RSAVRRRAAEMLQQWMIDERRERIGPRVAARHKLDVAARPRTAGQRNVAAEDPCLRITYGETRFGKGDPGARLFHRRQDGNQLELVPRKLVVARHLALREIGERQLELEPQPPGAARAHAGD